MNVLVRQPFSECAVWREALGNSARLLVFATAGECLDAPTQFPAGGQRSTTLGSSMGLVAHREN